MTERQAEAVRVSRLDSDRRSGIAAGRIEQLDGVQASPRSAPPADPLDGSGPCSDIADGNDKQFPERLDRAGADDDPMTCRDGHANLVSTCQQQRHDYSCECGEAREPDPDDLPEVQTPVAADRTHRVQGMEEPIRHRLLIGNVGGFMRIAALVEHELRTSRSGTPKRQILELVGTFAPSLMRVTVQPVTTRSEALGYVAEVQRRLASHEYLQQ